MRIKVIVAVVAAIVVVCLCIFCAAYFGMRALSPASKSKESDKAADHNVKNDKKSHNQQSDGKEENNEKEYSEEEEPDVPGWGRNVTRDASVYVRPLRDTTISHMDQNICFKMKPLVILVVCSDTKNAEPRKAIRETWAKDAHLYNILVIFLLGISPNEESNTNATQESIVHKDIIFEDVVEAYFNLTIKSIFMLKWVQRRCRQARFLFKTDDDSYINITNLYNYTIHLPEHGMENFLVGRMWERLAPHREPNSKWYVPKYIHPIDFPPFVLGIGYLMSIEVAERLYFESISTPMVHIEDAYITGILANKINVTTREEPLCHPAWDDRVNITCESNETRLIVVEHKSEPKRMYEIRDILNKC